MNLLSAVTGLARFLPVRETPPPDQRAEVISNILNNFNIHPWIDIPPERLRSARGAFDAFNRFTAGSFEAGFSTRAKTLEGSTATIEIFRSLEDRVFVSDPTVLRNSSGQERHGMYLDLAYKETGYHALLTGSNGCIYTFSTKHVATVFINLLARKHH